MRLFEFSCGDHTFDEFAESPEPRPCPYCSRIAKRRWTPPYIHMDYHDTRMSMSLGVPVSSKRQFREEVKRLSEKDQKEYEVVGDASEWANHGRLPTDRYTVAGGKIHNVVEDPPVVLEQTEVSAADEADLGGGPEPTKPSSEIARELWQSRSYGERRLRT